LRELDRELGHVQDKINDFERSFMGNFAGIGAGSADRKKLEQIKAARAELHRKIGINRNEMTMLDEIFRAMDRVDQEIAVTKKRIFLAQ
jgi:ABC-type proline/glycine betaine transport system substrate-binding protein